MIYYRVAFRVESSELQLSETETWKWRSTILTSPHALSMLLKAYNSVPQEYIRVFFTASEDDMEEMLWRQNQGQLSSSLPAEQFLTISSIDNEVRRLKFELSTADDHDQPYYFTLPSSACEYRTWLVLMHKVQCGELIL